jgi:PAS domain S-box-containing protein
MRQKTRQNLLQKTKELEDECNLLRQERTENGPGDKYMREILNNVSAPIYLKDIQGNYLMINQKYEDLAQVALADIVGKNDFDIFPQPVAELFRSQDEEVIHKGISIEFEETIPLADGIHTYITSKFPLHGNDGAISAVGGFCTDITARKQTEEELNKHHDQLEELVANRTTELEQKTLHLEEYNVALKVLLQQREEDKKEIEEKMLHNVEKLVFPYLDKLKTRMSELEESAYLEIIESNLKEIIVPFSISLSGNLSKLTPAEIQIADLIRKGKTTKEIAELLKLSPTTIATHRQNIRKKLALTNKKKNLRTILATNQ